MIQTNELRIGNLTMQGVVSEINMGYFRVLNENKESLKSTWFEIEPIPLTEEWLIKFGFEEDKANGFSKDSIHIEYIAQVGYVFFINGDVNGASITIEYVHELQNLYFALRGQELTITH